MLYNFKKSANSIAFFFFVIFLLSILPLHALDNIYIKIYSVFQNLNKAKIPEYAPDYWNLDYDILNNNNCYNYAMNTRTDSFAQPGNISGIVLSKLFSP